MDASQTASARSGNVLLGPEMAPEPRPTRTWTRFAAPSLLFAAELPTASPASAECDRNELRVAPLGSDVPADADVWLILEPTSRSCDFSWEVTVEADGHEYSDWFWAARTSLQRSRTLRGSLGRDMRGFASRCARLAASYIVEFTKTLVHELGHMNELCGSGHCCTGTSEDGDCLSPRTTNYDCGHDLPKMLWAGLDTFDYGLPRRTEFPNGPFSRESYSIMQGTVGKHCGCTDHTVRGEAANHDASRSLINMLPADALCGFWAETHLQSGSRRRCVVQWSISPFCSSGADISVGHLLFDPGRR